MKKTMSLADLRKGSTAVIASLRASPETALRLRALGFCEGARVECRGSGIFKDPAAYYVKGALIALRNRDARKIRCVPAEVRQ